MTIERTRFATDRACLAIDFGGSKVAVALFEASGHISAYERFEIDASAEADAVVRRAVEVGRRILGERPNVDIGAVCPGVLRSDRILLAPNVSGWGELALQHRLQSLFERDHVRVDNDVKAAAHAESLGGALVGCSPGVYVNLGTGIASAIVVDGVVIRGVSGAAGEVGYNESSQSGVSLEEVVGAQAIVRKVRVLDSRVSDVSSVLSLTGNNTKISAHIEWVVSEVTRLLQQITHLLDPARIVIGGGLSTLSDYFIPRIQQKLVGLVGPPPELIVASFGSESSLHGARLIGVSGP
jgi:glucokinase